MFLQLISANRRNTLFNYAFHKSSLFSIFFYVFSKKLLTTSAFSCIVHYVVEMQRNFIIKVVQEWRNWQTRRLQVPVVAISCGFKSRFLHYFFLLFYQNPFGIVTLQAVSTEGAGSSPASCTVFFVFVQIYSLTFLCTFQFSFSDFYFIFFFSRYSGSLI